MREPNQAIEFAADRAGAEAGDPDGRDWAPRWPGQVEFSTFLVLLVGLKHNQAPPETFQNQKNPTHGRPGFRFSWILDGIFVFVFMTIPRQPKPLKTQQVSNGSSVITRIVFSSRIWSNFSPCCGSASSSSCAADGKAGSSRSLAACRKAGSSSSLGACSF